MDEARRGTRRRSGLTAALAGAAMVLAVVVCAAPIVGARAAPVVAPAADVPEHVWVPPCKPGGVPGPMEPACRSASAAERSAKFAQWMSVAGSVQVIALAVQIFAVIFTLRESTRASRSATLAATAATRQAEFTERGVETQLRAYVLVDTGAVHHREGEDTLIHVTVKNYGQTPAFRARAWVHSWVQAMPPAAALPEPPEDLSMSTQVMGPGYRSTYTHRHAGRLEGRAFDEIEAGRLALYVYGAIIYEDAFGKAHVTRYRLFCAGKGALAAGVLGAYPEGNDAD